VYESKITEEYTGEDIKNYYEFLVYEGLSIFRDELSDDDISDAACIALNTLPSWYIRHNVDAQFYLNDDQLSEVNRRVTLAIDHAITKVKQNSG